MWLLQTRLLRLGAFAAVTIVQKSLSMVATTKPGFRLGYVTDVEGNLNYFLRYVNRSNVLRIQKYNAKELTLDLKDDSCYFVYGGDAVDKGPGDIRFCRALVDLQDRYPDRVVLLVGNRDLNKLRLMAELADDRRSARDVPPPHWDPNAPSLQEYLENIALKQEVSVSSLDTPINRLHYMLEHTLGCPKTFEFRREELQGLQPHLSTVSDDDVLASFLAEIQPPNGSLFRYLSHANVAAVFGNTLFCHGAVDERTMRFVPSANSRFENSATPPDPGAMVDDVGEWIAALNEFLHDGLADFVRRPYWNADWTSRGGEALMALQNRSAMWGRSIVSNCYGDGGCIHTESATQIRNDQLKKGGDPLAFERVCSDPRDVHVASWLKDNGIQRVVVGHKPTGDCPAVLSCSYTGVEVVSADTSFSDTSSPDCRGLAVGVVEIVGTAVNDNHLELSGLLRNGVEYSSTFPRLHKGGIDTTVGDSKLGTETGEGWWIKASTPESYLLTRGHGRVVEFRELPRA